MTVDVPESSRVYIDPPVFGQINPPAPAGRQTQYAFHEITTICRELRGVGWDARAIVVKRRFYTNGQPAEYELAQPKNWGFVTELAQFVPHNRDYKPIKVAWVDGTVDYYWPEDLFLIENSRTQTELATTFKRQMNDDPPV